MNPILATILIANMLFMIYDMIRKRQSNRYAWFVLSMSLLYLKSDSWLFMTCIVIYSYLFYSERKQNGDMKKRLTDDSNGYNNCFRPSGDTLYALPSHHQTKHQNATQGSMDCSHVARLFKPLQLSFLDCSSYIDTCLFYRKARYRGVGEVR